MVGLIITNAIYFKGGWSEQFDAANTMSLCVSNSPSGRHGELDQTTTVRSPAYMVEFCTLAPRHLKPPTSPSFQLIAAEANDPD